MLFEDEWPGDRSWKEPILIGLVALLLVGGTGYHVLTTATPVTRASAVARFRSQIAHRALDRAAPAPKKARAASKPHGKTRTGSTRTTDASSTPGPTRAPAELAVRSRRVRDHQQARAGATPAPARESSRSSGRADRDEGFRRGRPKEGVYSWATRGYESFSGSRRSFPSETQRIITHDGPNAWTTHHYFSEERESWSGVVVDDDGYLVPWQRNRIVFGPVTRDVTLRFDPPLRTGSYPTKVGKSWSGSWEGPTHGDYRMRVFDRTTMNVGGTSVKVWAVEMFMTLRGENEGDVHGKFWVDPTRHLVVREHYRQDVQSGPGTYRAEWDMTLKSLDPQR